LQSLLPAILFLTITIIARGIALRIPRAPPVSEVRAAASCESVEKKDQWCWAIEVRWPSASARCEGGGSPFCDLGVWPGRRSPKAITSSIISPRACVRRLYPDDDCCRTIITRSGEDRRIACQQHPNQTVELFYEKARTLTPKGGILYSGGGNE
jgi:hypothetical protein